jgi:hypothetical protein
VPERAPERHAAFPLEPPGFIRGEAQPICYPMLGPGGVSVWDAVQPYFGFQVLSRRAHRVMVCRPNLRPFCGNMPGSVGRRRRQFSGRQLRVAQMRPRSGVAGAKPPPRSSEWVLVVDGLGAPIWCLHQTGVRHVRGHLQVRPCFCRGFGGA